jgi:DNA-binding LacI/PurR family transcriptional regulator
MDQEIAARAREMERFHDESSSLYKQIYEQLLQKIAGGELKAGDQLPSEKDLCGEFKVSRITSKKALEMLAERHLIVRQRGKGSFVAGKIDLSSVEKRKTVFRSVAFLLSEFNDAFGNRLICSIEEACSELGWHLILRRSRESPNEEEKALRELDDSRVAGILMMPIHGEYYNAEILRQVLNKRPLVFVDRKMRGLPAPSVSTDNVAAAEMGVRHLFSLGHKNIAFFSGTLVHTSTLEDRRQGYINAYMGSGLPFNRSFICCDLQADGARAAIMRHMAEHPEISAAFTAEFEIALLLKSALEELGRRVPEDFSIVTFDNSSHPSAPAPFSWLRQDETAIGRQAVDALRRIIQNEAPLPTGDILVPAELIPLGGLPPRDTAMQQSW